MKTANTADAAKRAELKPLPAKTRLRVKISPPVDSATAAAGDPITGVIEYAVKQKGVTLVSAGDKLLGRILRMEQVMLPTPRWTVAILFETISRNGIEKKISLRPLDDGDRYQEFAQSIGRRGGAPAPAASTITTERPAAGESMCSARRGTWCSGRSSNLSGRADNRGQFLRLHFAPVADRQISKCHRADVGAHELQNFAADRLDHAPHLTIAAFGDDDLQMGIFAGIAHSSDLGRSRGAVA